MRKSLIAGIALLGGLALAGQASAAGTTYTLNLWGASAQFQLYNQSMTTFLQGAPYYCTNIQTNNNQNASQGVTGGLGLATATLGYVQGSNCNGKSSGAGSDTIIVRISSKASYDGVLALEGQAKSEDISAYPIGTSHGNFCNPNAVCSGGTNAGLACASTNDCPSGTCPNTSGTADYHYRLMLAGPANQNAGCYKVDVALSDVYPGDFAETTTETTANVQRYGPGNARSFAGTEAISVPGESGGYNSYNPMIVPFGFYASKDVTYSTCASGVDAGQQCSNTDGTDASGNAKDCPTAYDTCTSGACPSGGANAGAACTSNGQCPHAYALCTANPLSNLSKLQAIMIFSGQAAEWQDFGLGYGASSATDSVGNVINACVRVAGSGTLATLDWGVMQGNALTLSTGLVTSNSTGNIYFNDGTAQELNCVNHLPGSIGFADADQALYMSDAVGNKMGLAEITGNTVVYANVMPLKFEGVTPSRRAIRNGEYDNFYSKEWVFVNTNNTDLQGTAGAFLLKMISNGSTGFIDQLSNPAAISATDRKDFWASYGEVNGTITNNEMWFMKVGDTTSDIAYPVSTVATDPVSP